jgi:hypothetical protein
MTKVIKRNGLELGFSYENGILCAWETSEDPHAVNSEIKCFATEVKTMNDNAKNVLAIIKSNFGTSLLDKLVNHIKADKL